MWNIELFRKELAGAVNIDSGSKDTGGVGQVGEYFAEKFKQEGLKVTGYDGNTKLKITTHDDDDFDVLLVGHMDTVFPKGTAECRPYTEESGKAHGPGVADMKGGLTLILHLVRRLRTEAPNLKICVAFNGDEELGSSNSREWLQSLAKHTKYAFVFEPGRLGNAFVRSRKGCADILVHFHGKAAHAGVAPEKGASAAVEMARWITEVTNLQDLQEGTSINAGLVSAGTASNVIPDYAEVFFDIRFLKSSELERIKSLLADLSQNISVEGVSVDYDISGIFMPMTPSDATAGLMKKMEAAAASNNLRINWVDTGGVSDANHIASMGIPTICGCGPCGDCLHSDDEYMVLESIGQRLDIMYSLLTSL